MRTLTALVLVLQLISLAFGQCGPAQCYSGCTDARVPLDLIFLIDISGSMADKINGVISGLTQFANDLASKSVIPWYNLITFADNNDRAVVVLNGESSSSTFKTKMSQITVNGGWEPSLETIRRAGNTASSNNFNLNLRAGSKRALILVTDEDSDPAYYSANRFQSSGNDGHEVCPPSDWSQWQNEINAAYTAITNIDASSYFLVSVDTSTDFRRSQTCLTKKQFGDFNLQSQSSDYKTFNAATTLTNLKNAGLGNSLQAQLLSNGKYSRVFKVELTTDSTFITNFFQTITADVSTCDTKCTVYPCSLGTCQTPQYVCGCDGVAYSGRTLDAWGTCCLPSERDCTGKCFGKSVYDECGVCGTSRSSLCVQDCKSQWYLTSKPSTLYITPDSFQPNSAGYLLMNSDLYTQFATTGGSLRSIDLLKNHFHTYGRFEGRYSCVFDANRYATQYGVSSSAAESDWLNNLLSSSTTKRQAYCVANSRIKLPPALRDTCNQCILTPDSPPYCIQDCSGVWRTSASTAYFTDNCAKCVAPGTNPDGNKDSCGVCFGGNADKNQCGVCFGTKALDNCGNPVCQGKTCVQNCAGTYEVTLTKALDPCGFCVAINTISSQCLIDCNGKYYKSGTTPQFKRDECNICVSSSILRDPSCFKDCSGVWRNSTSSAYFYDNCAKCVAPGTNPDANKDYCGVCFGGNSTMNQCGVCSGTKDLDSCGNPICKNITCNYNCAGQSEVILTKAFDPCGFCVNINTISPNCLTDCNGKYYRNGTTPQFKRDECNICVSSTLTRDPSCFQDCSGVWRTSTASAYFTDNCAKCVAPGTNPDANKDDCGVCFGKNANKNQCGKCYGTTELDRCNNPVCQNQTCFQNCDNEYEVTLTKGYDECGFCVLLGKRSSDCLTDCNGKYYAKGTTPQFKRDECGVCVSSSVTRSPDCVQDCSGKWNGTAYYDQCNQCIDGVDDFSCIQDCDGVYYRLGKDTPIHTFDSCSECNTAQDQNKLKDKCGICSNKVGYNSTAECTPDCKGIWTLPTEPRSFVDFCGDCWYANQSQFNNYRMDDCGICLASRDDPDWNKDRLVDSQGVRCTCFKALNDCVDFSGKGYKSCNDCPPLNPCGNSNGVPDSCGLCPGKSMYGKKDSCGMCCSPEDGIPCDIDIDDCGVCFGLNKQKQQNKCNICDSSKCHIDCNGTPNGTAVVGCDGICGSNAKCLTCGDGIISPELGETCDLGNGKNFKGSGCFNCQTEKGKSSSGSIIGGVIGGVAAVAFLGLSGFLAYKYAEKAGLIGKVGKNVDFSGSNNNPLYTSDTAVKANPLYIN